MKWYFLQLKNNGKTFTKYTHSFLDSKNLNEVVKQVKVWNENNEPYNTQYCFDPTIQQPEGGTFDAESYISEMIGCKYPIPSVNKVLGIDTSEHNPRKWFILEVAVTHKGFTRFDVVVDSTLDSVKGVQKKLKQWNDDYAGTWQYCIDPTKPQPYYLYQDYSEAESTIPLDDYKNRDAGFTLEFDDFPVEIQNEINQTVSGKINSATKGQTMNTGNEFDMYTSTFSLPKNVSTAYVYDSNGNAVGYATKVATEKSATKSVAAKSANYEPRTQKARSVVSLKKCNYKTPAFAVYEANDFTNSINENGQLSLFQEWNEEALKYLLGKFVRPCPMVPRHGFVDSRRIDSLEAAQQLITETLAVEPQAELISMTEVKATHSAIWTPGKLVIGTGNDGATAGISSKVIPVIGAAVSKEAEKLAGISESPYLELVWGPKNTYDAENKPYFVQLRNGPKLPDAENFIPETMEVKSVYVARAIKNESGNAVVVDAEGKEIDLLAWESKAKTFTKGTVIYHPNGSLASHVAVHAVLNNVPVACTFEPKVGATIAQTAEACELDIQKIRTGFVVGAEAKEIDKVTAVYIMLACAHSIAALKGKQDYLIGVAMGCAYRLTVVAALGEFRHQPGRKRKTDRDSVYEKAWNKVLTNATRTRVLAALFSFANDEWCGSFGGKKWYEFLAMGTTMYNHLIKGNALEACEALNQLIHAVHNGGWAFNKFVSSGIMDKAAQNPLHIMLSVAPSVFDSLNLCDIDPTKYEWFKKRQTIENDVKDEAEAEADEGSPINAVVVTVGKGEAYTVYGKPVTNAQVKMIPDSKSAYIQFKVDGTKQTYYGQKVEMPLDVFDSFTAHWNNAIKTGVQSTSVMKPMGAPSESKYATLYQYYQTEFKETVWCFAVNTVSKYSMHGFKWTKESGFVYFNMNNLTYKGSGTCFDSMVEESKPTEKMPTKNKPFGLDGYEPKTIELDSSMCQCESCLEFYAGTNGIKEGK